MQKQLGAVVEELAPQKVIVIRDPHVGLKAVVVVDNTACGPSIGGVRMAPDVSIEEVARLARAMTLKNAASGLPHAGGRNADCLIKSTSTACATCWKSPTNADWNG